MSTDPAMRDLLAAAREGLREQMMPALTGEQRYQAAMVAGAMAIVERSLADAGRARAEEAATLARWYPEIVANDLAGLRRQLAQEIRAGRYDGEAGRRLVAEVLLPAVRARLAVSSPEHRWRD